MAEQLTCKASKKLTNTSAFKYILEEYNLSSYDISRSPMATYLQQYVLIDFYEPAEENRRKWISSATCTIRFKVNSSCPNYKVEIGKLSGKFNVDDTGFIKGSIFKTYTQDDLTIGSWKSVSISIPSADMVEVARYGCYITATPTSNSAGTSTPVNVTVDASYFKCNLTYSSYVPSGQLTNLYPVSNARVDRTNIITFTGSFVQSATHYTYEPLKLISYTLKYKFISDSAYTDVVVTPTSPTTAMRASLPANTLSQGKYYYQFIATTNASGNPTITSSTVVVNANDTVPTAPTNLTPNGTIEDGRQAIQLSWTYNNESGTSPTKSVIYSSTNGADYTVFKTVSGSATSTIVNLTSSNLYDGAFYWKVETYNIDDVASPLSEPVHFNVIMAPAAPTINYVDACPKLTIKWSAAEQQAYEVILDGETVVKTFGSNKSWQSAEMLEEGRHTVSIAVQGATGLWSQYATQTVTIVNTPYGAITLDAIADDVATLTWQSTVEHSEYHIYRDGELIGTTTELTYTDEYSAGETEYFVRGVMNPPTNHTQSNTVKANVKCDTMICTANGGEWLHLVNSDTQHRTETITKARSMEFIQMAGRPYYEVERSEHYSETIQVTCSFIDESSKNTLEAMHGELVILKTNKCRVIKGCMDSISIKDGNMYTTYTFTVTRLNEVFG